MAVSEEFKAHVAELLRPVGPIGIKRMFGGAGVYVGETMFGLIIDDALHFKVDDTTREAYTKAGCEPFMYDNGKRRTATSYWQVPGHLLDEPDALLAWARDAVGAARRARKPPAGPVRRTVRAR